MPYSGAEDESLPKNVKALPTKKRRQWVEIWNSAYSSCQKKGGSDCEASAFRQANGVVFKKNEQVVVHSVVGLCEEKEWGDRTYLVAPVISICQGVLNGELLLEEEFGQFASSWDGRPIVLDHPSVAGQPVSANDPAILQHQQVGQVFKTTVDDGKMRHEMWVDVALAEATDDGTELVRRLRAGEPVEVSTAYWREADHEIGTYNEKPYEWIARGIRPDHLAVLLHDVGACSWQDGCGAPRMNEELICNIMASARTPTYKGTTTGDWSKPSIGAYISAYPGEKPESSQVAKLPSAVKRWIASHSLLGDPGADNERDLLFFPVVTPSGKLSAGALRAVLGGRGTQANIPSGAKSSAQAVARRLLKKHFQEKSENKEDGIETNDAPDTGTLVQWLRVVKRGLDKLFVSKEDHMDCKIKALVQNGAPFTEEELGEMSEEQLDFLATQFDNEPSKEETPPETPTFREELEAALSDLGGVAGLQEIKTTLTRLTEAFQSNADAEHDALVEQVSGMERCRLSKAQLQAMDVDALTALASSLTPRDYRGNGGFESNENDDELVELAVPDVFAKE